MQEIYYYKDYEKVSEWCRRNNYATQEIEPDENGRRFIILKTPEPTNDDVLRDLRNRREYECFEFVNRVVLWYNTLTEEQRLELDRWYKEWLDVTDKYEEGIDIESIIPKKPEWLK